MALSIAACPRDDARRSSLPAQFPTVEIEITRGRARRPVRRVNVPVFLIGTADDCDLVLGDPRFPEVHSYLFLSAGGVWVRHLGSQPSVSIGGRQVKSVQLCDGDLVRTGAYEFRIHIGSPPTGNGGVA